MQLLLQTRLQIPTPYMFLTLLSYLWPKVSEHVFLITWYLLLCFLLMCCVSYRGSATTRVPYGADSSPSASGDLQRTPQSGQTSRVRRGSLIILLFFGFAYLLIAIATHHNVYISVFISYIFTAFDTTSLCRHCHRSQHEVKYHTLY